jgi:hypothetical protein
MPASRPEPPRPPARAPASPGARPDRARLEAEARCHRDRLALYRARIYASKPTSSNRLRELERAAVCADERFRRARLG